MLSDAAAVDEGKEDLLYEFVIESRRLGEDTGTSTFVDLKKMLMGLHKKVGDVQRTPTPEELERFRALFGEQ